MEQVQAAVKRPEVSDECAARKESARAATRTEVTNKLNKLHILSTVVDVIHRRLSALLVFYSFIKLM